MEGTKSTCSLILVDHVLRKETLCDLKISTCCPSFAKELMIDFVYIMNRYKIISYDLVSIHYINKID